MADAEVHLKLVKAHLAALVAMEPLEAEPCGTAALPPIEPTSNEAGADREGATPEGGRDPTPRSRAGLVERGSGSDGEMLRPGAGERWTCPVSECQDSAAHSLDECEKFKSLSVPQREKAVKEWNRCECCLTDCRDRNTGSRCYRRIRFRRHHLLRLVPRQWQTRPEARGVSSNGLGGKPRKGTRTPPEESPTRMTAGTAEAKGSCRGDRQACGVFPRSARIRKWCGSEPPGVST
jgi:hypothetical protein